MLGKCYCLLPKWKKKLRSTPSTFYWSATGIKLRKLLTAHSPPSVTSRLLGHLRRSVVVYQISENCNICLKECHYEGNLLLMEPHSILQGEITAVSVFLFLITCCAVLMRGCFSGWVEGAEGFDMWRSVGNWVFKGTTLNAFCAFLLDLLSHSRRWIQYYHPFTEEEKDIFKGKQTGQGQNKGSSLVLCITQKFTERLWRTFQGPGFGIVMVNLDCIEKPWEISSACSGVIGMCDSQLNGESRPRYRWRHPIGPWM